MTGLIRTSGRRKASCNAQEEYGADGGTGTVNLFTSASCPMLSDALTIHWAPALAFDDE